MTISGSDSPRNAVSDVSVDVEDKINQEVSIDNSSEERVVEDSGFDDKVQKLKDLKEDGVVIEEEFKQKKEDIMDDI